MLGTGLIGLTGNCADTTSMQGELDLIDRQATLPQDLPCCSVIIVMLYSTPSCKDMPPQRIVSPKDPEMTG